MKELREACDHGRFEQHEVSTWTGGTPPRGKKLRMELCPGGQAVTGHPMIVMGGLSPAWYPAGDEDPDGWLVEAKS